MSTKSDLKHAESKPLEPLTLLKKGIFYLRRFVLPMCDIMLSLYNNYSEFGSCTTYFIASIYSMFWTRYVFFPISIFATLVCLITKFLMYRNMWIRYQQVKKQKGLSWTESIPYINSMMALGDKTPLGKYQMKISLVGLLGQDVVQIAIAYYNLNASRVDFTWIAYIRVGFSGIKLSYSFANFLSMYAKQNHRIIVKVTLFLVFAGIAFTLSYIVPKMLVLYNNGITVRFLKLTTTSQTCYRFANVTADMQSHMVGIFQQDTCSYGTNTTKCPLFEMLDLSKAPTRSIVTTAPTSFTSHYYFSPVYAAYLANSRQTETLLFENQYSPTQTLCGNAGIFYPDNVHISRTTLAQMYQPTNQWESLSAFLKVVMLNSNTQQGVLYAQYNDSISGDAYFAVGQVSFQISDVCILSK